MSRKLILSFIILIVLVGISYAGYQYVLASNKAVISTALSDRSKEFLATQESSQGAELKNVNFEKTRAGEHDFDSQSLTVPRCYSLVVPFAISDDRMNEPCVYYAILESPRGNMTSSLSEVGFQRVEEAPAVTFRQSKKDQYREQRLNANGISYIVFTDTTNNTEKTALGMVGGKFFSLTLAISASDEVQTRQMQKILASLRLE